MKKEINYQHKKISYHVIGEGIPVLLIHGFGEDSRVWLQQVPFDTMDGEGRTPAGDTGSTAGLLHQGFRFFIPDLPGSGDSELIDDMTMEGMAEAMHAIIHGEDLDAVIVIGHSMGGYITLALVEKYGYHIRAFGLFHSSAFADNEEKKATRRKGIEFIRQQGGFAFLQTATPKLFSPETTDENPELIDEFVATLHNFSGPALVSYYEGMMARPDRTDILEKTPLPVLFVLGKHDTAIPLEDGLKQTHLPEKSYIHVLQHTGHMGMMEEPSKVNALLLEFLQDVGKAP